MPMCIVMNSMNLMAGIDRHIQVPPPPAPPIPAMPYVTAFNLLGPTSGATTQKFAPTMLSCGAPAMGRGTDMGPLIPHMGPLPHILLPLEIPLSASKSYFGASTYKTADQTGAAVPVACCLTGALNININCGTPIYVPIGFVPGTGTHAAYMSPADIVIGIVQAAVEVAITAFLGKYMGTITRRVIPQSVRVAIMGKMASSTVASKVLGLVAGGAADDVALHAFAGNAINSMVGLAVGSPFGISTANTPIGQAVYSPVDAVVNSAVDSALNASSAADADPAVPTFDGTPPPDAAPAPSAREP